MNTVTNPDTRSLQGKVSDEEWQTRVDLAAAYRLTHMHGWDSTLIYNHISARIPGTENHFLLNPFGLRYEEVTASNLVKIDLDGNVLDDSKYPVNAAGFTIHSAVHAALPDRHCVFHTHTEAGMAVSALQEGLMFTNQDAMIFYGKIAYHDYEGIALELDERERLVRDLDDKMVMILRNHGLLTTGKTIGQAFMLMYFLEKVCSVQLKLMASGGKIIQPPHDVLQRTADQYDEFNVNGDREWPALVRMLDEVDSSYRS